MTTNAYELAEAAGLKFHLRPNTSDRVVFEDNVIRHSYEKHGVKVEAEDAWMDVGGYIGTFAIPILSVGAKVTIFEPDPENADLIEKNLALNGLRAPIIRKAIVGQNNGPMPLYKNTHRGNMAANTLYHHWKKERPSVMVQVIDFGAAFAMAQALMGAEELSVKFDCEGAEIEILEALQPDMPIRQLTMEYHFSVDPSCERYWKLSDKLSAYGFSVHTSAKVPIAGSWPNPRQQTIQVFCAR